MCCLFWPLEKEIDDNNDCGKRNEMEVEVLVHNGKPSNSLPYLNVSWDKNKLEKLRIKSQKKKKDKIASSYI